MGDYGGGNVGVAGGGESGKKEMKYSPVGAHPLFFYLIKETAYLVMWNHRSRTQF